MLLRWLVALATLLAGAWPAHAQQPLPVPALTARVIDQTGTLNTAQQQALESKLAAFEAERGTQMVVLLVATTQPEDIAAYAQRIGDAWKIGRAGIGDGLLIVVAVGDRRVNIQTTKTLEGAVPDLAARQVIDRAMRPAFRAGDYAGGLDAAADQLFALIRGEALPLPGRSDTQRGIERTTGLDLEEIALFLFVAVPVMGAVFTGVFGRKLGSLITGGASGGIAWAITASVLAGVAAGFVALLVVGLFGIGSAGRHIGRGRRGGGPPIIWGGSGDHAGWGGGGWSSGGGGGGFSSGGGGDFGGGGASGDW